MEKLNWIELYRFTTKRNKPKLKWANIVGFVDEDSDVSLENGVDDSAYF